MVIVDGRGQRVIQRRTSRWLVAGRGCAAVGWVLWVALQVIAKDPFPPNVSVSQYGIGEFGWVFTVWAVALAAAPLLLLRGDPVPGPARWLLRTGFAGAAVMAVVRTDEGGGAMSWHAWVHMVGAVVALVYLPLGILVALRFADRRTRRIAGVLGVAAAVVGALVLVSATGVDTAGLGAAASWALWQGTLVVIDMLLVTVYAVTAGRSTARIPAAAGGDWLA